jgi:hypothetical protein
VGIVGKWEFMKLRVGMRRRMTPRMKRREAGGYKTMNFTYR